MYKLSLMCLLLVLSLSIKVNPQAMIRDVSNVVVEDSTRTDWDIFIEALIQVESKGNSKAVGAHNDVGVLQITPIYVEEVNRILGEPRYSMSCRKDSLKSIEMFEIYQSYYNPNKNISKAIRLHNPGGGTAYIAKVNRIINRLKIDLETF